MTRKGKDATGILIMDNEEGDSTYSIFNGIRPRLDPKSGSFAMDGFFLKV